MAEAEIAAPFAGLFAGFTNATAFDLVLTASTSDELAAAFAAVRSTSDSSAAVAKKFKIICNWDGVSTLAAGAGTILAANNFTGRSDGHLDQGGGIYVVAAAGRRPRLGNQINICGLRGIHFDGIGFYHQWTGSGATETVYGAQIASNPTYPAKPVVLFTNCEIGARNADTSLAQTQWISGINTTGLPDYVGLFNCRFNGHQSIAKLAVRFCRVDGCDFQGNVQDAIDLFGHTAASGYYAYAWISRCTFRNVADGSLNRNEHMDSIQTGTSGDLHLGYRCLYTDLITHGNHSYAGDPGAGGGTQGLYNDDLLTADNQFVVRRCIFLVSSPSGFACWSPRASKVSFIDQCTFMRCGSVPSSRSGDGNAAQDFGVGITGTGPVAGGPWFYVTRCYGMDLRTSPDAGSTVSLVTVDPRNRGNIAAADRPEAVFKGRDFTRGGPAANGIAGKFGYVLPNEAGNQAAFVADVWANFEPVTGFAGIGSPDPRSRSWPL